MKFELKLQIWIEFKFLLRKSTQHLGVTERGNIIKGTVMPNINKVETTERPTRSIRQDARKSEVMVRMNSILQL